MFAYVCEAVHTAILTADCKGVPLAGRWSPSSRPCVRAATRPCASTPRASTRWTWTMCASPWRCAPGGACLALLHSCSRSQVNQEAHRAVNMPAWHTLQSKARSPLQPALYASPGRARRSPAHAKRYHSGVLWHLTGNSPRGAPQLVKKSPWTWVCPPHSVEAGRSAAQAAELPAGPRQALPEPRLDAASAAAFDTAYDNIRAFHAAQRAEDVEVETMPGVRCRRVTRPIGAPLAARPAGRRCRGAPALGAVSRPWACRCRADRRAVVRWTSRRQCKCWAPAAAQAPIDRAACGLALANRCQLC